MYVYIEGIYQQFPLETMEESVRSFPGLHVRLQLPWSVGHRGHRSTSGAIPSQLAGKRTSRAGGRRYLCLIMRGGREPCFSNSGANHCVLRTSDGRIITFGAHRSGQLGRGQHSATMNGGASASKSNNNNNNGNGAGKYWFAEPTFVEDYGPATGRIATWVWEILLVGMKEFITKTFYPKFRLNFRELIFLPPGERTFAPWEEVHATDKIDCYTNLATQCFACDTNG